MLEIEILNTRIDLSIQDREFYSYMQVVLEDYLSAGRKDADIVSKFQWQEEFIKKNPLRLEKKSGYDNIGPNIALAESGKRIEFLKKIHGRRLKSDFDLTGRKIKQELYCHKKVLKDLVSRLKQRPQHMDFFEIGYFLFYYPLFWSLENFKGIFPMHASCVDTPKGGIIIAGLPGSGKSVTSLALWSKYSDNRLLSDNIILHDRQDVYACPEPIRLHAEGKQLVGDDRLARIDAKDRKSSKGFYMVRKGRSEISKPAIFLLIRLSEKYSLKEIDTEAAVKMAFNQNLQGAELLNYFEYASLLSFLNTEKSIFKERMDTLNTLFKGMRSFSLSVPRNKPIDPVLTNILNLL